MDLELLEKDLATSFHAIEAKHAGQPGRDSAATDQPAERIKARLRESMSAPDVEEFQCNTKNDWDKFVLYALLKRYGIKPYRYRKQRKSTTLVRVSKGFMNDVLWPIFTNTADELYSRFTAITTTLLPAIATGPFSMAVLDHDHSTGQLCENCRKRLLEEGAGQSAGK